MAKNDNCDICGCNINVRNNKRYKAKFCKKHYDQMYYNGFITDKRPGVPKRNDNEIIINDDCAQMILYDMYGYELSRTTIDLDDVEKCKKYKWYLSSTTGYIRSTIDKIPLHRYLLNASKEEFLVDHIDNNKLNNRKSNLRPANKSENAFNIIKPRTTNTSGFTGVVYASDRNKWHATLMKNYKTINLGYYTTKEEAIEARKNGELMYFGEYAPGREDQLKCM